MKTFQTITSLIGVGVLALGVGMALTNPDEAAFENFALAQLQTRGCQSLTKDLPDLLKKQCPGFVLDNQAQLKQLIRKHTDRRNYGLFSLYRTRLSTRSLLPDLPFFINGPTFNLETAGLLGQFHLYDAEQQRDTTAQTALPQLF